MNPILAEIAKRFNGVEYRHEPKIKDNNIVVVYGASDDIMVFQGAINDEISAWKGTIVYINGSGLFSIPGNCDNLECPYIKAELAKCKKIEAVWGEDGYSWTYETDIPHITFDILEDGVKYCKGIVFALDELE